MAAIKRQLYEAAEKELRWRTDELLSAQVTVELGWRQSLPVAEEMQMGMSLGLALDGSTVGEAVWCR